LNLDDYRAAFAIEAVGRKYLTLLPFPVQLLGPPSGA
jgi:hypothetical protein